MRLALALALVLMSSPIAAAQDSQPEGPRPDRVQISPGVVDAEVGQTIRFSAAAYDANGGVIAAKPTAWLAAPFDVGAADDDGLVTLFAAGELKVGAIVNGKTGLGDHPHQAAAGGLGRHRAAGGAAGAGSAARLDAATFTKDGIPREGVPVSWKSESPSVATVDAAGVVTAIAPGRATIRATSETGHGRPAWSPSRPTRCRRLAIEPRIAHARTGDVVRFTARGGGHALPSVQWSVGGAGATIDPDGGFVAERPGTFLVTATYGTRVATSSVVVAARNVQRALELVGRTPAEEFQTLEQWTFGDYLYATSALSGKLWVYDITSPAAPIKVDALSFDARILNDISVTGRRQDRRAHPRGRLEPQERHRLSRHVRPGAPEGAVGVHRDGVRRRAQRLHRRPLRLSDRRCDGVDAGDRLRESEGAEGSGPLGAVQARREGVRQARKRASRPAGATCTTCR